MSNENKIVCKCKQNSIGNVAQRIEFFEMGGITRAEAEAIEHAKKQQRPPLFNIIGGSRSKKHNKKLSRSSNRKNTKLTGGKIRNRNRNRNRTLNRTRTRNRTRKELEI